MSNRVSVTAAALALAAGIAGSAHAQEFRLSMSVSQHTVATGQSVDVEVLAHLPASVFALAEVGFDLASPAPAWVSATSGLLAGDSVLGAGFSQAHEPFAGIFADASKPIRVWHGQYRADVPGPAFIKLETLNHTMAYYPNGQTNASVSADPLQGREYLWVDPVHIPSVGRAAPGEGTGMHIGPDGSIIATPEDDAILIGLLLPAVQKVHGVEILPISAATPARATPKLILACATGQHFHTEELAFVYDRVEPTGPGGPLYELRIEASFAFVSEICLLGLDGQQICIPFTAGGARFGPLPTCLKFEIIEDELTGGGVFLGTMCGSGPIFVSIPGVFEGLTTEPVEVRVMPIFIDYIGIDGSSVDVAGLPSGEEGRVEITFPKVCAADFNGDGAVGVDDVFAYLSAWFSGVAAADFNGDGAVNIDDLFSFLAAWFEGCPG